MNDNFQINGQKKSLSEITQQLSERYMKVITLIENFSNKELFTKKYFDDRKEVLHNYFIMSQIK